MEKDRLDRPITFADALVVLFAGLKLCDVVTWNWWVVFSPILIPAAVGLTFERVLWLTRSTTKFHR